MTMRRCVTIAVLLVAVASEASAQEPGQILILPFTSSPEIAPDAGVLDQVMTSTATALGHQAISAQASRADIAVLSGCPADDIACYETVAETVGVDRVVFGSVDSAPGGGLAVTMTLIEPGAEPRRRSVVLTAGGRQALEREFGDHARALLTGAPPPAVEQPAVDLTPPPEPVTATGGGFSPSRVEPYSWAVAGTGVALIGLGSVLLMAAQDKQDEVDGAPTDTVADLERLRDLEDRGKSLTRWGNVALIAGGVATVAGVALIIKQAGSSPGEPPAASIAPTPVAGGLGLTITVRGDL
jgi:hypothetical protein